MQRGVMYGMMAGALWGMVFLVPRLLSDFSPLLLSAGGLFVLVPMVPLNAASGYVDAAFAGAAFSRHDAACWGLPQRS